MNIPVTVQLSTTMPSGLDRLLSEGMQPEDAARLFPNTIRRLTQLAQVGVDLWKEGASKIAGSEGRPLTPGGAGLPMVRLDRKAYQDSIVIGPYEARQDGVRIEIYSDSPQAVAIEQGSTIIDLHAVLAYSSKVRMSKKGKRYLYIPFRHATTEPGGAGGSRFQSFSGKYGSNVLPPQVISAMRSKKRYQIVGETTRPSVNYPGQTVRQNIYSPHPGRLTAKELNRLGIPTATPAGRKLVGLMKTGNPGHTSYLTIRTLSEANPEGWRIPAYQAQHVAQSTARSLQALSSDWFDQAIRADIESAVAMIEEA